MTPTESPLLNTVAVGETFSAFCCIRYLEMRLTQDNRRYLLVELGDRSGRIRGRLWKDADRLRQQYSPGQLVRVKGMVRIYHGRRDLRIMAIRPLNEKDDVSLSDMLPRSEQDGEQFMERFLQHCRSIGHPELRKLVELLIGDPLLLERLGESPAGKLWHHNYLGGLLEHLVMALELAVLVQRHYAQLDSDLLRSAIILHGLGHLSAYRLAGYIEFSDEGRLLGRQQLACQWTADLIGELPSFPADLRL